MFRFKKSLPVEGAGEGTGRRPFPRWKKVFITTAVFLVIVGLGFQGYGFVSGRSSKDAQKVALDQKNVGQGYQPSTKGSFWPEGTSPWPEGTSSPPPDGPTRADTLSEWSPSLLKGGMSFLVGFALGYAVRMFFRFSAAVVGVVLLAIFGLSYAGVLQVDWNTIQQSFDQVVASVKGQLTGFQSFIAGSLPSAGLAGVGLFTGFKKH